MLVTHKASELRPQTRAALEAEYGRPLQDDEEVGLLALVAHDAPTGAPHRQAARALDASLTGLEEGLKDIPVDEFEEIFLEAMRNVRTGYEEVHLRVAVDSNFRDERILFRTDKRTVS